VVYVCKTQNVYVYHLDVMLVILESVKAGKIEKHFATLWQSKEETMVI
jgi:hypothetical protein